MQCDGTPVLCVNLEEMQTGTDSFISRAATHGQTPPPLADPPSPHASSNQQPNTGTPTHRLYLDSSRQMLVHIGAQRNLALLRVRVPYDKKAARLPSAPRMIVKKADC